jgi:hypothetical protein
LLNFDYLLAAGNCLGLHHRLGAGFQISSTLGFSTHPLNRVHHIGLLRQERIPQIRRPLNIVGHACDHIWISYQSLDTWIPRLLCHGICQRLAL